MSEIWVPKVSCWTDLSPTTILLWVPGPADVDLAGPGTLWRGGVYPGYGSWVGAGRGYTGTQPQTHPRTHI